MLSQVLALGVASLAAFTSVANETVTGELDNIARQAQSIPAETRMAPRPVYCPFGEEPLDLSKTRAVVAKQFIAPSAAPAPVQEAMRSVVMMCFCEVTRDTCMTAFAFGSPGHFLTNAHALEGWLRDKASYEKYQGRKCVFMARTHDGHLRKVHTSPIAKGQIGDIDSPDRDNHLDLALMEVSELAGVPSLSLRRAPATRNEPVWNLGHPLQSMVAETSQPGPRVSSGRVIEASSANGTADFLSMFGMSGGPVVDSSGQLVGVFWGKEKSWRESLLTLEKRDAINQGMMLVPPERSYFIPAQAVGEFCASAETRR